MPKARDCSNRHIFFILMMIITFPPDISAAVKSGNTMNVAPFGEVKRWSSEGRDYGVIWEDSRDISRVVVRFAESPAAGTGRIGVEYWQSTWPGQRIPRDQPSGSGSSGWLNIGDWYQGKWLKADTKVQISGSTYTFTFNPVNAEEFPREENFPATYRSTLKLRIIGEKPLPKVEAFEAYTDSLWSELEFEIEWAAADPNPKRPNRRLEAFNGYIKHIQSLDLGSRRTADTLLEPPPAGEQTDGVRANVLYAETKGYNSFDETIVTVRYADETFSFAVPDLIAWGHIFLPDFGVIVRRVGDGTTYIAAQQARRKNLAQNIYARVAGEDEQTFPRAWKDIPAKEPFYIPLGFDGGRQYFGLEPDGSVFCRKNWLTRIPGKDTKRCQYDGDVIRYSFGFAGAELIDRSIIDGCLPIVCAQWQRGGVRYRQTAFAVPLDGVPEGDGAIYADDTLVLMMRMDIEKTGAEDAEAKLDLDVVTNKGPEQLAVDDGMVFAAGTQPKRLRMLVSCPEEAARHSLQPQDGKVVYSAKLTADAPARTLYIAVPYITLNKPKELEKLRSLRYNAAFDAVRSYWRGRIDQGTRIVTPEPMINDFYNAHVSHLLLNTDRQVGASDRYVARVGTFSYGAYSNESCMMVSDLDRRGYHKRAEQALETWLYYQGSVGLPGDFSTNEGQFYGAAGYESGGYNQHHGFVLWCLGEHYRYTHDLDWLTRAAPKIVKGCDWIINERKRTTAAAESSPIRAIERGLLPAGNLEDIRDWRIWLSTNVYSWWGMDSAARALADAGLPDGPRLLEEAAAYRRDILAAFIEAMRRSPVVRLRDGSWIPHIPPEVHRRGRTFGWITETLEGPIHMIRTGLLGPWDPVSTWIIQDYEDNLYISEQYGYNITGEQFDKYWFSRGGISQQANLLCNPIPYLLRDEPKHFLRAYFNAFAVSYFPDTRMMTEHALPDIGDHRGDHYKSSDEANSTYWLRLMFVDERGDELLCGGAIPRYWLADGKSCGIENSRTYFGPMSVRYESKVSQGRIEATLEPPHRNPPKKIFIRFRHPEGERLTRCEIDGKPCTTFDAEGEWVMLTDFAAEQLKITAFYD